MKLVKFITILY